MTELYTIQKTFVEKQIVGRMKIVLKCKLKRPKGNNKRQPQIVFLYTHVVYM